MGMKQTLDVINRMEVDGIIGRYAIAGAVAAYNYVEPTVTEDVDILMAFDSGHRVQMGLITLGPILSYLKDKGYSSRCLADVLRPRWHRRSLQDKIRSMKRPETTYPDISDILQRKAEGRRDISRRPFGEKIAMMEALRERLAPFKRLRAQRRAAKRARPSSDAS